MGVKVFVKTPFGATPVEEDFQLKTALKKFKKQCNREGVTKDFRRHEFFEKPSDRKRRDKARRLINIKKAQKEREEQG